MHQSVDYLISQMKVEPDQYAVLGPVKVPVTMYQQVYCLFVCLFVCLFYSDPSNVVTKDKKI